MPQLRYLSDVVTLTLDTDKCTGCGMCTAVCPHAVFAVEDEVEDEVEDKKARIVDRDACMECGACALNCPAGALSVNSGVGCATAVIIGALRGGGASCGCSSDPPCCE